MDIPLMDHVIIGLHGKYFSFYESGILGNEENNIMLVAEKKDSIMETLGRNVHECRQTGNTQEINYTQKRDTCR